MSPEQWQRVRALFEELGLVPSDERAALLEREPDAAVRAEVASLLASSPGASRLIKGVVGRAANEVAADVDPLIGTDFVGRYRIEALLGTGGMGSVYRATQLAVGRPVALKVLLPEVARSEKIVRRFEQEAKTIAALHHPNIIALHDFGRDESGRMFLVMEYVEGESLADLLAREAPLAPERVVHIARQVLDALAEAHAAGIVHRDLKPENLFVTSGRRKDTVKVLDFGIAKITGADSGEAKMPGALTDSGIIIGSARYMAPEQARAEAVTAQTDLYALGAIIYEALAGRPVFVARNMTDLLIAQCLEKPRPIVVATGELDGPLIAIMLRCLEKTPSARPASAEVMIAALEAMRGDYVVTVPTKARRLPDDVGQVSSETGRAAPVAKRRAIWPWVLGGVVVLAVPIAVVLAMPSAIVAEPSAVVAEPAPMTAPEPLPAPVPAPEPIVAATRSPEPAPDSGPTDATVMPPSAREVLTVVVDSDPRGARVLVGDEDRGPAPVAVSWREGETPPSVTLVRGAIRKSVELTAADAGKTVTFALATRPKPVAAGTPEPEPEPPKPEPERPKPADKPDAKPDAGSPFRMIE